MLQRVNKKAHDNGSSFCGASNYPIQNIIKKSHFPIIFPVFYMCKVTKHIQLGRIT